MLSLLSTIYNTTGTNSHSNRYFRFIMIWSGKLFHCSVFHIFSLLGEPFLTEAYCGLII